jgi:hypothetical protein
MVSSKRRPPSSPSIVPKNIRRAVQLSLLSMVIPDSRLKQKQWQGPVQMNKMKTPRKHARPSPKCLAGSRVLVGNLSVAFLEAQTRTTQRDRLSSSPLRLHPRPSVHPAFPLNPSSRAVGAPSEHMPLGRADSTSNLNKTSKHLLEGNCLASLGERAPLSHGSMHRCVALNVMLDDDH